MLLISDFDGTLVDTFQANFLAYKEAFAKEGLFLTSERYRECFGFRFDKFMSSMGITDKETQQRIRENKKENYPYHFAQLRPNKKLIKLIKGVHALGGKTAIASTARKENLMNALGYLGIENIFDLIMTGEDVKEGKPSPEIYQKTMEKLGITPEETIIFEDSEIGMEAARRSGAEVIQITLEWFI